MPTTLTNEALATHARVILPSMSFPADELAKITGIAHYEERFVVVALIAAQNARAVYITSVPIAPEIVDYYVSLAPDPQATRERITFIALNDTRDVALSEKLAGADDALANIREAAGPDAFFYPFNVTENEARIADALEMPTFGAPLDLVGLGSKTGSRRVAKRAGALVLDGEEDLHSLPDIEAAISRIRPEAQAVVVKFNNGFSGMGNAIIGREQVRSPLSESDTMFCSGGENWTSYSQKIAQQGAIVEELVTGKGLTSPSVQIQISPSGVPEVLSTHDQVLGDPRLQVYLGCRFPADDVYRATITEHALAMAGVLAGEGVIGPFGVDFIVVPDDGAYVSEINLRMGGTTHPQAMARFVTRGTYDQSSGLLIAHDGEPRFYMGTDNLKSERLKGQSPAWALEQLQRAGLLFDSNSLTGVTVHMLGAIHAYGKLGTVAIGTTTEQASDLARSAAAVLTDTAT